jgi:hypothetical protein
MIFRKVNVLESFASNDLVFIFILVEFFLLFFALIVVSIKNRELIREKFQKIRLKYIIALGVILFVFFISTLFLPHHYIQPEEISFVSISNGILNRGVDVFCENNICQDNMRLGENPIGWSLVILILLGLFGISLPKAFFITIFFSLLNIVLIFYVSYLLFKKEKIALLSSLFFALLPLNLFWATKLENNVVAISFMLLTLFFLIFKKKETDYLAIFSYLILIQIRAENLILLPILLIYYFKTRKIEWKHLFIQISLFSFIFVFGIIPQLFYVFSFDENLPNAFNIQAFFQNIITKFFHGFNFIIPFSIFIIGLFGFFLTFRNRKDVLLIMASSLSFLFFWTFREVLYYRFFLAFNWVWPIFAAYFIVFISYKLKKNKMVFCCLYYFNFSFDPKFFCIK